MNYRKAAFFLSLIIGLFMASGCQTDPENTNVQDEVEKYLGSWSVSDQPARINYSVTIERDPVYEDQIYLYNFADAGGKAIGLVVGKKVILDKQDVGSGYQCSGQGEYISSTELKFEFLLDDGIDSDPRVANYSK